MNYNDLCPPSYELKLSASQLFNNEQSFWIVDITATNYLYSEKKVRTHTSGLSAYQTVFSVIFVQRHVPQESFASMSPYRDSSQRKSHDVKLFHIVILIQIARDKGTQI